ncbi:hypothetical protein BX286_5741 [Streptomyces sp. 3211.6]|nr:hypothetical protein BX286_5741 [Streptomyces sp. 3211.6]RPF44698.1 hypothetical protein EDD96_1236 [Streptomyces sp. Ag109_G2-6]
MNPAGGPYADPQRVTTAAAPPDAERRWAHRERGAPIGPLPGPGGVGPRGGRRVERTQPPSSW